MNVGFDDGYAVELGVSGEDISGGGEPWYVEIGSSLAGLKCRGSEGFSCFISISFNGLRDDRTACVVRKKQLISEIV